MWLAAVLAAWPCCVFAAPDLKGGEKQADAVSEEVVIRHLKPEPRGGRAYKLVYTVPAALDVYWRFKTDFESDFPVTHRYIRSHRLISRIGAAVLTENTYANAPDAQFRWKTHVFPYDHRLSFYLTNPEECGQRFHYGYIQAEPLGERTRVTQVAYFDFRGASLWALYPWGGGMNDFLVYTARWEQETVLLLKGRYSPGGME